LDTAVDKYMTKIWIKDCVTTRYLLEYELGHVGVGGGMKMLCIINVEPIFLVRQAFSHLHIQE
jgi:hypothetical protein